MANHIRVAYDISLLGANFSRFDRKSGIFRVVEEVMLELNKIEGIELTPTGLCGEDPLASAYWCLRYLQEYQPPLQNKFDQSFKSYLSLDSFYWQFFEYTVSEQFQKLPKAAPKSIVVRAARKIVNRLRMFDCHHSIDAEAYDLFHSPYPQLPSEDVTRALPRLLTINDLIPVTAPQFVLPEHSQTFQRILNSINLKRDWVICISEYTKQEFCEYTGMSPERIFVISPAVAEHFYPVRETAQIEAVRQRYRIPDGSYLLSVGTHLEPRKNLVHLIHCFCRLLLEKPDLDASLVIVGSKGKMADAALSAIQNYAQFRERVVFTGYVPDEDLSTIYSGAKAFVYPSLYEGFGLPPLEAMKCGVPVITSNVTSLPEVVGEAGIMVNPKDEDALCQAMLNILSDEELWQKLSSLGLERSRSFSWKNCAAATADAYRKVVSCT